MGKWIVTWMDYMGRVRKKRLRDTCDLYNIHNLIESDTDINIQTVLRIEIDTDVEIE
jgi:hypothetical protein